ncbi:MAG: peptide deformylase [Oscillospiraceae bacterium]|nr:peptide deformylase [Oscillospiraceae bacterium]
MVRPVVTDIFSLNRKAAPAGREDLETARDLLDTLAASLDRCVGMAANMIGVNKRIIAISFGGIPVVMLNPVIVKRSPETYETEEGCLSLSGVRKTVRHRSIEVTYQDMMFRPHRETYSGFAAQIIQHEVDHCEGILI